MAEYPEWVLKHKKKGTYVNHVNGNYYLYAAHSERVPGTNKVKRVFDAYLGRITEESGLIPPKEKVSGSVTVYEYGLSTLVLSVCKNIHTGLRKTFAKNGDLVMAAATLSFMYGKYDEHLYRSSHLCIKYPGLALDTKHTDEQTMGIERGFRMISDTMHRTFNDDLQDIILHFRQQCKVKINGKLYLSEESGEIQRLKKKYNLK